jgi:hypothetical protein
VLANVINDSNGLSLTFNDNVDAPANTKVFFAATGSGVATAQFGSVVGQSVVLNARSYTGAVMPGSINSYSIAVQVTS